MLFLRATRKRAFSFFAGTNQLATIADINSVIANFNQLTYYRPYHISVRQVNQADPSVRVLMVGSATDCPHGCSGSADSCECANFLQEKQGGALISQVKRTAQGIYDITFNATNDDIINNRGVGVMVEPVSNPNVNVVIDKTKFANDKVITIKTYDTDAAQYIDGVLNDTIIQFYFYTNSKEGLL